MIVLVVAAHPDDEVLGLGGTIARHADAGDDVHILLLADGESARTGAGSSMQAAIAARQQAANAAAKILGAHAARLLGLPDNQLDTLPLLDIVRRVEKVVAEIAPDVVYTHHLHDLNVDHRLTAQAVLTACRPLPGSHVRAIYSFETPSSTEWSAADGAQAFVPRRYVDIADVMARKIEALQVYDNEMREFPHPRSYAAIKSLAKWRGASSGLAAAEAFDVLRMVERH